MGKPSIRNVSKKVKAKKSIPEVQGQPVPPGGPTLLGAAVSIANELAEIKGTLKQIGFLLASREAPKKDAPTPAAPEPEAKAEKPKKERKLEVVKSDITCPVPKDGKPCGAEVEKVGEDLYRCKAGHTFKPAEYAPKPEGKKEDKPTPATIDELREASIAFVKSFSSQELGKQELGKILLTVAPEPKMSAVPDEKRASLIVRLLSEAKKRKEA